MFNAQKATDLAGSLLLKAGGSLSIIKLMKLLYICDRESIKHHAHPITFDKCVSMPHGPVLSCTYNMANGCGGNTSQQPLWNAVMAPRQGDNIYLKPNFVSPLDAAEQIIVGAVWNEFNKYDDWDLVDYTHNNFAEWRNPNGSSNPIDLIDIFRAVGYGYEESEMLAENMYQQAEPCFNFDLKRIQQAVEAPSVKIPHGLKGKDLRAFILEQANAIH